MIARLSLPGAIFPNPTRRVDTYLLYDSFGDARSAGGVDGTIANVPPGVAASNKFRFVKDTNGVLSITGGTASFATGGIGAGDPGLWWNSGVPTAAGRTFAATISGTNTNYVIGWDNNQAGTLSRGVYFNGTSLRVLVQISLVVGTSPASGTTVSVALTMRKPTGMFFFIKETTAFPQWTMLWPDATVAVSSFFPAAVAHTGTTSVFTVTLPHILNNLFIPAPTLSDGFDGVSWPLSDGNAHFEENGGGGVTWSGQIGSWTVSSGAASAVSLSGGLAILTAPCGTADVLFEAALTRSAGVMGLCARYQASTDYLICYIDGTNAKLDKIVAGVTTNLISAAVTYSAGAVMRLIVYGTSADLYYNNLKVGSTATVPSSTQTAHGLYTTDTGNTFDNVIAWPRGTGGQWAGLSSY